MIFQLTPEEQAMVEAEVHDENSPIVKFCVQYMKDNWERFKPSDIRGNFDESIQKEKDMINALCVHLGVSTEKCQEKFLVICRWMKAMAKVREIMKGYGE